jgi:16S rRNA (cytidine1402-2'-O)-methyltransferase
MSEKQMGTLYVVGMPESNLADVTLRALRVLHEVDLIVALDLTGAQALLAHYGLDTPLVCWAGSGSQGSSTEETMGCQGALEALRRGDVALILATSRAASSTSAGRLVHVAVEQGFAAVAVPGPSAVVTALVASGLPTDAYVSLGFVPEDASERRRLLISVATEQRTLVAFLASGHLPAMLRDAAEIMGDRPLALLPISVGAGEGGWRGTVSEAVVRCGTESRRGEWTLVIGGAAGEPSRWPEDRVRSELSRLLADGLSLKEAARQLAVVSGWRPREVYRLFT